MQALLSFDKAPPFAAPLKFFLAAPLFAMLAGLLLVIVGPELLASRWSPFALAATHLLTVGFMLQVMLGALLQILPVVGGANVPQVLLVSRLVHAGLSLGTVLLAAAFLTTLPLLFIAAAGVLAGAVLIFLATAGWALFSVPSSSPTLRALKLSMAGLAGVLFLGCFLSLSLALGWSFPLSLPQVVSLHTAWGLGAWAGVLLAGMSYVVVPMFQLTPGYSARFSWWWPLAMAGTVVAWTAVAGLGIEAAGEWFASVAALVGLYFAGYSGHLQRQRRRARPDATSRYWQLGLACTMAALLMPLIALVWPAVSQWDGWTPLFAVLLLIGGFMSFIIGMLYKIIPFLAWLHLQNMGKGRVAAPNMNKLLPEKNCRWQMFGHLTALLFLLLAVVFPDHLSRLAGFLFLAANGWLLVNLLATFRRYRKHAATLGKEGVA